MASNEETDKSSVASSPIVHIDQNNSPEASSPVVVRHSCKNIIEEKIITRFGSVAVHVFGDRSRPVILTYHDLGLNAIACFQNFFEFGEMSSLIDKFCVYNINAPGQEENADAFAENYVYPTMEELTETVAAVVHHYSIHSFIGFGAGAGANILCRYALEHPKIVDALILINCTCSTSGWIEWGFQKANIFYLKNRGTTLSTLKVDYLMWHYFGRSSSEYSDKNLMTEFRNYFTNLPHPRNVTMFIDSYVKRSAMNIRRPSPTLSCPVLQIVGANSPHVSETIDVNQRLDPTKSDWLKISDSTGLVLEEQPAKISEAILLFLQGQGHLPAVSYIRFAARRPSEPMQRSMSVCQSAIHRVSVKVPSSGGLASAADAPAIAEEAVTASAKRRSHSIATPGGHELVDNSLLKLFDNYHINRSKDDVKRLESIEEPIDETLPTPKPVDKENVA